MPKVKTHHEGNSYSANQPYPQSDEALPPHKNTSANNEGAQSAEDTRHRKNATHDLSSPENVLKCLMKYHKTFIESTKQESLEIVAKMEKANMAYAEKNQENIQLKKRVCQMEQDVEELGNQNKQLNEENDLLKRKCAAAKAQYTSLETGYDKNLYSLNSKIAKLHSILIANNNEKADMKLQLTTETEQSQQKIAHLETMLGTKESEMVELQIKYTQLEKHTDQMGAAFQCEKQQIEQKFVALVQSKEDELLQLQTEMQQQTALNAQQHTEENAQREQIIIQLQSLLQDKDNQLVELQLKQTQLDQYNNELKTAFEEEKLQLAQKLEELAQLKEKELSELQTELQQKNSVYGQIIEENSQREQMIAQLKSLLLNKENQMVEMQLKQTELEKHNNEMKAAFEEENQQLAQKIKELAELKEKELLQLQAELQQQATTYGQKIEDIGQLEAELQSIVNKLEESERNCLELQQHNNQLSNETLATMQQSENIIQKNQAKIDSLYALITSLNNREKDFQTEINELKEVNEQLKLKNTEEEAKTQQKHESQITEQTKQFIEMQQHHLNITKKLTAEKNELVEQLATFKELKEQELKELRDMLHQKDVDIVGCKQDYADLERQKNSNIAELNYKIAQIGNVFSQPIGRATPLKKVHYNQPRNPSIELLSQDETETVTRPQSVAPVDAADKLSDSFTKTAASLSSPSGTSAAAATRIIRRRPLLKRPTYQSGCSDFNTDDDTDDNRAQSDWEPRPKKLATKNVRTKRVRNVEPQKMNNLFDQLKKSSNV